MLQMKIPEEESLIVITTTIASPAAPRSRSPSKCDGVLTSQGASGSENPPLHLHQENAPGFAVFRFGVVEKASRYFASRDRRTSGARFEDRLRPCAVWRVPKVIPERAFVFLCRSAFRSE